VRRFGDDGERGDQTLPLEARELFRTRSMLRIRGIELAGSFAVLLKRLPDDIRATDVSLLRDLIDRACQGFGKVNGRQIHCPTAIAVIGVMQ